MKTILVLTDFSTRADHAAAYALKLALKIKADILLCNVFPVPEGEPVAAQTSWPIDNFQAFEEDSHHDLNELATRLDKQIDVELAGHEHSHRPLIEQCCKVGEIADVVNDIHSSKHILMAVIGTHGASGLTSFLLGDHAREVIEKAHCPVMIVPDHLPFVGYKKIAFATDLANNGIEVLNCLAALAKYTSAEILITHVADDKDADVQQPLIKHFFNQVSSKINYPHIYYRSVKSKSVATGLDWLTENTDIDLLVLVHRKRNFFQKIFEGSVTQKLAGHLTKPMLVFPSSKEQEILPVF